MGQLCKGHHYMDCVVRKQFILEGLHSGFMCIFHSVSVWYHFPHKVFIQFIQHLSDWHQNSHIAVSLSVFFDASNGVSNVKNAQIRHKVKWLCLKGTSHTHYHIFTQILFGEILERVKLLLCFICSIIANWHAPASPVSQLQRYQTLQPGTADSLLHSDQRIAKLHAFSFTGKVLYRVRNTAV